MLSEAYKDALFRTECKLSEAWSNLEHAKERVVDYDDDVCKQIHEVQQSVEKLMRHIERLTEDYS